MQCHWWSNKSYPHWNAKCHFCTSEKLGRCEYWDAMSHGHLALSCLDFGCLCLRSGLCVCCFLVTRVDKKSFLVHSDTEYLQMLQSCGLVELLPPSHCNTCNASSAGKELIWTLSQQPSLSSSEQDSKMHIQVFLGVQEELGCSVTSGLPWKYRITNNDRVDCNWIEL